MAPVPDILKRPVTFWGRASGHQWSVNRIRSKLSTGTVDFAAEAERLTEADFGPEGQYQCGDDEARIEWHLRAQSVEDCRQMLEC